MGLTAEQKERIRKNRERALQIQKEKREEIEKEKRKIEEVDTNKEHARKRRKSTAEVLDELGVTEEERATLELDILESFEEDASPWVTKKEAARMYCLPEGTLAVCKVEEKANPHNKSWNPMKMYSRVELRYRARKRHGGLHGLVEERKKRQDRRLVADIARGSSVFSSDK